MLQLIIINFIKNCSLFVTANEMLWYYLSFWNKENKYMVWLSLRLYGLSFEQCNKQTNKKSIKMYVS